MANLTGGLLERSARSLRELVEPGGFLIVSGFMDSENARCRGAREILTLEKIDQEEEWMCAVFRVKRTLPM